MDWATIIGIAVCARVGVLIDVYVLNASPNATLMGGAPLDPSVPDSSLAVQAIFTLNENSTDDLEGLLAGLLLNASGNVTGWLDNATSELGSLGLLPSVLGGLANATYPNDGGYGAPVSSATEVTPPEPWWEAPFAWVWNTVTGVFTEAISIVWTAAVAAATFVTDLGRAAERLALASFSQASGALKLVAGAVLEALKWMVSVVWGLITRAIDLVLKPLSTAFKTGLGGLDSELYSATNTTIAAYQGVSGAESRATTQMGATDAGPLVMSLAIGVAIDSILYFATPFDIDAGALVGFLSPLILSLFTTQLDSSASNSLSSLIGSRGALGEMGSVSGFDSLSQWLFNQTHNLTSISAGAFVDSPGDYWSLIVTVAAGGALVGGFLGTLIAIETLGSGAAATLAAATALICSVIALVSVIWEYLLSLVAPEGGLWGQVALTAELGLAVFGSFFGLLAILAGGWALVLPGLTVLAGLPALISMGFGATAAWAGYNDIVHINNEVST